MVKIKIVFTDAGDDFKITKDVVLGYNSGETVVEPVYIKNNSTPISTVFNRIIREERTGDSRNDMIVFMHGDVELDFPSFIDHLIEVKDRYDVIGLAGTKKMNVSKSPLNWFTSSFDFQDERYGRIVMEQDGEEKDCFYNLPHHPDVRDTHVACIDGLCIAIGRRVIESDFLFKENISDFDFYDTDISLQSNLIYKFRIGVIVEKARHYSVGTSITHVRFLVDEINFRKAFNLSIPEDSPIRHILKKR